MSHPEQRQFCESVRTVFPSFFKDAVSLDVGSLDINGNNRYLFSGGSYIGLDIIEGKNVDVICPISEYEPNVLFDVIVSTEMLEHDWDWEKSIQQMYKLLRKGGLLLLTCAGTGRPVHGTIDSRPHDSPATNTYYKNISIEMLKQALSGCAFIVENYSENIKVHDTYFWGIKTQ